MSEIEIGRLLLYLAILLGGTYGLGALLVRARIPAILGALMVAMAAHYTPLASALATPQLASAFDILAELGVLLLLFYIGLQIDIGEMRRQSQDIVLLTILNTLPPFILGAAVMLALGYGPLLAFVIGLTRMPTAEAVIVPVLDDFGLIRTRVGEFIVGAGVLDDVAGFDCDFFNISPREAEQMDPQQRLLLELTVEALERGGVVPGALAGANCSVHVGISSTDYADIRQGDPTTGNAYSMTGSTLSVAANRISYLLDLRGPSVAIDTACSSALFALDDAWRSIRQGRADMAIVGAVSLLLSPYPFIGFSKAAMLSPDGRCRAFGETADGYVRGEGGGVMVLRKLADAERDGEPIFAVLRGIATNNDGRTMGIAQPSADAQEKLLREVYRAARVKLRDIAYIEAHGTGTSVGDPIEAASVGRAIARRRPRKMPLYIGSAKSNIGHLEPASGMAGLIKAIEVLRRNSIPPSLHVGRLNPEIDFDALNLRVAAQAVALPATEGAPVVGVNSFGFGGTNAHAILQAWRPAERPISPLARWLSCSPAMARNGSAWVSSCSTAMRRSAPPSRRSTR